MNTPSFEGPATPRRLADDLLDAEGMVAGDPASVPEAAARVLGRLHEQLRPLVGTGGFQTLLGRAVVMGARDHSDLLGLSVPRSGAPAAEDLVEALGDGEGTVSPEVTRSLIAELLGFLARLVGWELTLVLLREPWSDIAARYEPSSLRNSSPTHAPPDRD